MRSFIASLRIFFASLLLCAVLIPATALADPLPTVLSTDAPPKHVVKVDAAVAAPTLPAPAAGQVIIAPAPAAPAEPTAPVTRAFPDPNLDPFGAWQALADACRTGNGRLVAAILLMLLIYLLRQAVAAIPKVGAWFKTDRGGAVLALVAGVAATLSSALWSANKVTFNLIVSGFVLGLAAGGGWSMMRRILPASWFIPPPKPPTPTLVA